MITLPSSVMMWALTDTVIERRAVLDAQFRDIRRKGFGGVAAIVRCGRYAWTDAEVVPAFLRIGELCAVAGMHFWLGMDPRGMRLERVGRRGAEIILYGNAPRATRIPNDGLLRRGSFSVKCSIPPRETHVLTAGAIDYTPLGLYAAYALSEGAGESAVEDISDRVSLFFDSPACVVTASGKLSARHHRPTRVCPFFRLLSTVFDFSDPISVNACIDAMEELARAGVRPDGMLWDEPGFICMHGSLPISPPLERAYKRKTGRTLREDVWKLAFDSRDQSHIPSRIAYFAVVQEAVQGAQQRSVHAARRIWGEQLVSGVHDTWRWESADASDRNHGSLDLWRATGSKSAGFTDLGSAQLLRDPASPFYANLAAACIAARSLGLLHRDSVAYQNLWLSDAGRNSAWTVDVMDHCVTALTAFGLRWIAHIYGPAGTPGREDSFLGLPYTPGYPRHPTWGRMNAWTRRLAIAADEQKGSRSVANILVVFPVEQLFSSQPREADHRMRDLFAFLLALTDRHHQVDLVSSVLAAKGKWRGGRFTLLKDRYDLLLLPFQSVLTRELLPVLEHGPAHLIDVKSMHLDDGTPIERRVATTHNSVRAFFTWLDANPHYRLTEGPPGTWITLRERKDGLLAYILPARSGGKYSGSVVVRGRQVELPQRSGLTRVLFSNGDRPRILG